MDEGRQLEIEKLLKRHLPQVEDTGYPNVSLNTLAAAPKKKPVQKPAQRESANKDFRHSKPAEKKGYVARNQAPGSKPKTQGSRSRSR